MKTLKLFNAVLAKDTNTSTVVTEEGLVIEGDAVWLKDNIISFYRKEKLNAYQLNRTFHKSWQKIKESSRFELFLDQVRHYISTYGSDFQDEVYIPDEILCVPNVKISLPVVKALTREELINMCLNMLRSGIALKEDTIDDLLLILTEQLRYEFTGEEGIKNKEAIVKLADLYGVLPSDVMGFFRYIVYRATGETLLIKSNKSIEAIKESSYNPSIQFNRFGLERLATIFNRFKPLFLAFKPKCPRTINKISKLSKKLHIPLSANPLNQVTSKVLTEDGPLKRATPYALFKALSACGSRVTGQHIFAYRIRNGRSWVKEGRPNTEASSKNIKLIMDHLKERYDLTDKTVYFPKDVRFALPTSEKMFVGNIPTGTKFLGDKMAVGVYWKNSWGARDLDLSGLNAQGKVGWNSTYNNRGLYYSGDITNASNGAVEYLYANNGLRSDTIILNNVYYGDPNCGYRIIVGKGDDITKDYMMNPKNLFVDVKCESTQKQTVLGLFLPEDDAQSFVLLNFGAGNLGVSRGGTATLGRIALVQQWRHAMSFNDLMSCLGATIVDDPQKAEFDFSLEGLHKNSFIEIFN